jgi:hypothetical protein
MPSRNRRADAGFALEVVLAGLVVFAVALTIGLVTGAESGSVAEWVGAISTLAAFLAAVVAAWFASKAYGREVARDRQLARDQRRRQAGLVAAWGATTQEAHHRTSTDGSADVFETPSLTSLLLTVRNASELPVSIFQVHIYVGVHDTELVRIAEVNKGVIEPGTNGPEEALTNLWLPSSATALASCSGAWSGRSGCDSVGRSRMQMAGNGPGFLTLGSCGDTARSGATKAPRCSIRERERTSTA